MLRVLSAASLAALALPAFATDYTVTTTMDVVAADGEVSLREAIQAANTNMAVNADVEAGDADGDTISIADLTITLQALNGALAITDDVEISGTGTVDGGGLVQLFTVDAGDGETVAFDGVTLTGGTATTGAAIQIAMGSTVTLNNVDVTDNVGTGPAATNGGAVDNAGTLTITGGSFTDNTAVVTSGSGGAIHNWGTLDVTGTSFTGNTAARAGGAIEQRTDAASMSLTDVTMDSNEAGPMPGNGGGVHISQAGSATISGGTYSNNIAANEGGALWNGGGTMTVDGAEISTNTANGDAAFEGGGGIFNEGGTLTITNTDITGNVAAIGSGGGGGIFNNLAGTLTVSGGTISNNVSARAGGGIETRGFDDAMTAIDPLGTVTLNMGLVMDSNGTGVDADDTVTTDVTAAPGNGGAFHSTGAQPLVVDGITVSNNQAAQEGGGIWTGGGESTINDTTFTANGGLGDDASDGGGGLFNQGGTVTVTGSTTFDANTALGAAGSGGAVLNNEGTMTFEGTAFTNNMANRAGGGIEDRQVSSGDGSVTLTLTDVTASANAAGVGDAATAAPGNGGFLHVSGNAGTAISGGEFTGNLAASEGGALWTGGGASTIDGATITGNAANGDGADNGGGGLFNQMGDVTITGDTTISMNTALGTAGSGGGIFNNAGTVTITGATISSNTSNRAGGGIEDLVGMDAAAATADAPSLSLTDVTMESNSTGAGEGAMAAPGNGGAVHLSGPNGYAVITGGLINGNTAANEGGGLWNGGGSMDIIGTTVSGNTVINGEFAMGVGDGGGGLFNVGGTMTVTDATVTMNTVPNGSASGGGLLVVGGDVTVTTSDFTNNSASRAGGAIEVQNAGTLTVVDSTLDSNETGPMPGNGGGVHVSGGGATTTFSRTTVSNNTAANEGGGLWNFDNSTMNIWNSTLFGNTADGAPGGGGLFNRPASITNALNVTIAGNTASAGPGGGVANADDTAVFTATNTVIANNTGMGEADLSGTVGGDFNFVATAGDDATVEGDNSITGADAGLATALADNGGPTQTLLPNDDSPLVDAGDLATCTGMAVDSQDQRGGLRPFPAGGDCDIGAVEVSVAPMTPVTANGPGAGAVIEANAGDQNVSAVGFGISAPSDEDVVVSSLTFTVTGSGDFDNDVTATSVFVDADGDGIVDDGDVEVPGTLAPTDTAGEYTFTFTSPDTVDAGTTTNYVIALDFGTDIAAYALPMLAGGGLLMLGMIGGLRRRNQLIALAAIGAAAGLAGCENDADIQIIDNRASFQLTVTDIDAAGADTGLDAMTNGLPVTGPVITVAEDSTP